MSKTIEMPGQQALIDLPPGAVIEPEDTYTCYADWATAAESYILARASKPGAFTFYAALKDAPKAVRDPSSSHWQGLLATALHGGGYLAYALDEESGRERWTPSEKPESGGSGVRMWVGTAAKAMSS